MISPAGSLPLVTAGAGAGVTLWRKTGNGVLRYSRSRFSELEVGPDRNHILSLGGGLGLTCTATGETRKIALDRYYSAEALALSADNRFAAAVTKSGPPRRDISLLRIDLTGGEPHRFGQFGCRNH